MAVCHHLPTGWGFPWRGLKGMCALIEFKVREGKKMPFFLHKSSLKLLISAAHMAIYKGARDMVGSASEEVSYQRASCKQSFRWPQSVVCIKGYIVGILPSQKACLLMGSSKTQTELFHSLSDETSPVFSPVSRGIFGSTVPQYVSTADHTEFLIKWIPAVQVRVELAGVGCLCSALLQLQAWGRCPKWMLFWTSKAITKSRWTIKFLRIYNFPYSLS